jgi:hypothetical protein
VTAAPDQTSGVSAAPLRSPETVMRLERVGSFHPTRISFTRTLVRRMAREGWRFQREMFDLDDAGIGTAVYRADTSGAPVWFVVFADHLDAADRTDRVIAEKWDATFTLTTVQPDPSQLARLKINIPLQETGRCSSAEMVLSRANKSVRLFDHVAEALAAGRQPDRSKILNAGYLVRTTAVYGNGKFGLADLDQVRTFGVFGPPFQAEMLCVFMARQFSLDWVEHIAERRAPETFTPMDDGLKRALGVGNATGLGMAPFLIGHPKLINSWIVARETALARVRAVGSPATETVERFRVLLTKAAVHVRQWPTSDPEQQRRCAELLDHLEKLRAGEAAMERAGLWDALVRWAETELGLEAQELLNSLIIELYPDLVDDLGDWMGSPETMTLDPAMSLADLLDLINHHYDWALKFDFATETANARFWYRSEEKEEPRLGWRFKEPGAGKEMRIAIARDAAGLRDVLVEQDAEMLAATVAEFLMAFPEWRQTTRRIQSLADCSYAEFQDNLIDATCRPIDLLRCKLSMFGATKFDPKSDLWTRVAMFQGAPLAAGLGAEDVDDWAFPILVEGLGA